MGFKVVTIEERFGPYRKPTEVTIPKYEQIQQAAFNFAQLINVLCPDSPEKSTALTDLMKVKMGANAAIAIYSQESDSLNNDAVDQAPEAQKAMPEGNQDLPDPELD